MAFPYGDAFLFQVRRSLFGEYQFESSTRSLNKRHPLVGCFLFRVLLPAPYGSTRSLSLQKTPKIVQGVFVFKYNIPMIRVKRVLILLAFTMTLFSLNGCNKLIRIFATSTPTPTLTATATSTYTPTPTYTVTPTFTATSTPTPTTTPTQTPKPTLKTTFTSTNTVSPNNKEDPVQIDPTLPPPPTTDPHG